jgi:hypothetical protein
MRARPRLLAFGLTNGYTHGSGRTSVPLELQCRSYRDDDGAQLHMHTVSHRQWVIRVIRRVSAQADPGQGRLIWTTIHCSSCLFPRATATFPAVQSMSRCTALTAAEHGRPLGPLVVLHGSDWSKHQSTIYVIESRLLIHESFRYLPELSTNVFVRRLEHTSLTSRKRIK